MNELQHFYFKGRQVRTLNVENEPMFVGKDVADILGYKNGSRDVNAHVESNNKKMIKINTSGQSREMTIINESGLYSLILGSRLPKAISLGKALGLNLRNNFIKCDEAQTLYAIEKAIDGLYRYKPQYPCGAYRIDLYLPEYKIAIECDELGHADRDKEYEDMRQKYIEKRLGCSFVRYNPDSKKFNIFYVINKVLKEIRNKQSVGTKQSELKKNTVVIHYGNNSNQNQAVINE